MDSIETNPYPLAFKLGASQADGLRAHQQVGRLSLRTATRAMSGMQKEALVHYGPGSTTWRLACDEGPWLEGTNLAPFPLGFFNAGLLASYMSEFLTHARHAEIEVHDFELVVDNFYSMEGSLLRGTMVGSALPVKATFTAKTSASASELQQLSHLAIASSPADAMLRQAINSVFSLNHNGKPLPVTRVASSEAKPVTYFPVDFHEASPPEPANFATDIVNRLDGLTELGGEELGTQSGSAVGLVDNQKRTVHVRGVGKLRPDGLKELRVACFQPVGSVFQLLSDDSTAVGGQERAPSGLVYLSAGLSFCFMTQLGRYAKVAKHDMQSYQILQDTSFSLPAEINEKQEKPVPQAVDTQVFVENQENEETTQTLLSMSEQTCYLHAACRGDAKTIVITRS